MSRQIKHSFAFLGMIFFTVTLLGCGIKPSVLQAPEGADKKEFPSTYPHPDTIEK